jgi:hypothetical protein
MARLDQPILRGRPGMVARVDGFGVVDDGCLVVLEHRAGRIQSLVDVDGPVEAWHCRLLGALPWPGHQQNGEIYVPDVCLTAVATMNADQRDELRRQQARMDFDAAMRDLGLILAATADARTGLVENLDDKLASAGHHVLLLHALQVIAMGTALFELGFRHEAEDQDLMRWVLGRRADRLRFEAIQEPFGRWQLSCHGRTPRSAICSEETGPAEGCRGELLVPVLRIWQDAYPGEAVPQGLKPAVLYLRHRRLVGPGAGADAAP